MSSRRELRERRHKKIRSKVKGIKDCPRFSVFRSLKHIYGQIIDDEHGKTLISVSDLEFKDKKIKKTQKAREAGRLIAKKALEKKITKIVFDRGGYKYHGRVKAIADGAREGGLKF